MSRFNGLSEMDAKIASKINQYLESVPTSYKGMVERALTNSGGRANAVRVKCLSCCNYQRVEVENCTVILCPLHGIRPYQDKREPDEQV